MEAIIEPLKCYRPMPASGLPQEWTDDLASHVGKVEVWLDAATEASRAFAENTRLGSFTIRPWKRRHR